MQLTLSLRFNNLGPVEDAVQKFKEHIGCWLYKPWVGHNGFMPSADAHLRTRNADTGVPPCRWRVACSHARSRSGHDAELDNSHIGARTTFECCFARGLVTHAA